MVGIETMENLLNGSEENWNSWSGEHDLEEEGEPLRLCVAGNVKGRGLGEIIERVGASVVTSSAVSRLGRNEEEKWKHTLGMIASALSGHDWDRKGEKRRRDNGWEGKRKEGKE